MALRRLLAVSDASMDEPDYRARISVAVSAGIEYALVGLESGADRTLDVPGLLLAQARLAAHRNVNLDILVRRCVAANSVLRDFLLEEFEKIDQPQRAHRIHILRVHDDLLDHLLARIGMEYHQEQQRRLLAPDKKRFERIRGRLEGKNTDLSDLGYELGTTHVGLIAVGKGAGGFVRQLASDFNRRSLITSPDELTVWAWLGGDRSIESHDVKEAASTRMSDDFVLSIGEPASGEAGWQKTHEQAKAALTVGLRREGGPICYADHLLLIAILQDELNAESLDRLFMVPLETARNGGADLRATLRAYFRAERNVSSTASRLKISRRTVSDRLNTVETLIGRPIRLHSAELEAALDLRDL